jgi:hypothetical protein
LSYLGAGAQSVKAEIASKEFLVYYIGRILMEIEIRKKVAEFYKNVHYMQSKLR